MAEIKQLTFEREKCFRIKKFKGFEPDLANRIAYKIESCQDYSISCYACRVVASLVWRNGWMESTNPVILCNSCGIQYGRGWLSPSTLSLARHFSPSPQLSTTPIEQKNIQFVKGNVVPRIAESSPILKKTQRTIEVQDSTKLNQAIHPHTNSESKEIKSLIPNVPLSDSVSTKPIESKEDSQNKSESESNETKIPKSPPVPTQTREFVEKLKSAAQQTNFQGLVATEEKENVIVENRRKRKVTERMIQYSQASKSETEKTENVASDEEILFKDPKTPGIEWVRFEPQRCRRKDDDPAPCYPLICVVCRKNDEWGPTVNTSQKRKKAKGDAIWCHDCGRCWHSSCFEPPLNYVVVSSVPWRCGDCKYCEICLKYEDDENVVMCDRCDKGYHTYCLEPPLEQIPENDYFGPCCAESREI